MTHLASYDDGWLDARRGRERRTEDPEYLRGYSQGQMELGRDPAPVVDDARYARGQKAVSCPSDGSGYKTRAMRLCEHVNGRWSNRERAYIMSPRKAQRAVDLFIQGRDASPITGKLKELHGA